MYILYIPITCSQVRTAIALDLADIQADDPAKSRVTLDVTGMCLFYDRARAGGEWCEQIYIYIYVCIYLSM